MSLRHIRIGPDKKDYGDNTQECECVCVMIKGSGAEYKPEVLNEHMTSTYLFTEPKSFVREALGFEPCMA